MGEQGRIKDKESREGLRNNDDFRRDKDRISVLATASNLAKNLGKDKNDREKRRKQRNSSSSSGRSSSVVRQRPMSSSRSRDAIKRKAVQRLKGRDIIRGSVSASSSNSNDSSH